MKHLKRIFLVPVIIITAILLFACNNNRQVGGGNSRDQVASADTAVITFREYEHDFGKIAEGEKVACIFTFENTGKGPLVLSSVSTSCGCTVPKFDTKPIAPGGTGIVEVVFDATGRSGKQTKSITVSSNASKPIVLLRISGDVITSTNN
jgi:hypothetical protein